MPPPRGEEMTGTRSTGDADPEKPRELEMAHRVLTPNPGRQNPTTSTAANKEALTGFPPHHLDGH